MARSPLGAPGAFALPESPAPALHPQRMDACAFVGVAPRGPARLPVVDQDHPGGYRAIVDLARPLKRSVAVPVRSFDEYRHIFGGFEGPGLLPHAVASYFEQGGRVAWIVRVVHARKASRLGDNSAGVVIAGAFTAPCKLIARNEGAWGNALRARISFQTTAIAFTMAGSFVQVGLRSPLTIGSTLRLSDALGAQSFALVTGMKRVREATSPREHWQLELDTPPQVPVRADLVEARIEVSDGQGRSETFDHLALVPEHPEGLANVLVERSGLAWPHADWAGARLIPKDAQLELISADSELFEQGKDDWESIVVDDFFDGSWAAADEVPGEGICALASMTSVSQLVVPDLYLPSQWVRHEPLTIPKSASGAEFGPCPSDEHDESAQILGSPEPPSLRGLIRDPRTEAGLADVIALQRRVVDFCEATQSLIALVDVPPGLSQGRIERWRAEFDSSWAAAYHPWLIPGRGNADRDELAYARRQLPPSAIAAGIIARRELARGVQHGPANELAREIIHVAEPVSEARADALHPLNINCFVREPAGIVLIAARTLSRESAWRQLSVRRLMLMMRRALLIETQWAVFEPNAPALWRDLKHAVESFLRGLFRAGAFAGRTEAECFFVRIANESFRLDRGELLIEIGVAPAEPLEFILVRLRRDGDGTLNLEA